MDNFYDIILPYLTGADTMTKSIMNSEDWENTEELCKARIAAVTASVYDGKELEFKSTGPEELYLWLRDSSFFDMDGDFVDTGHRCNTALDFEDWYDQPIDELIDRVGYEIIGDAIDDPKGKKQFEDEYKDVIKQLKSAEKDMKEMGSAINPRDYFDDEIINILYNTSTDEPASIDFVFAS